MKFLLILLVFANTFAVAQNTIRELKPVEIQPLDLSPDGASAFEADYNRYLKISQKMQKGIKFDELSIEEQRILNETDETMEDYWDVIGGGCSWYCGGGPEEITSSSALKPQGANTYEARHAHDLSYKSAWVEGVAGYGIGEHLIYSFSPESPRITDIIVVNGYVKSERAYLDNSRVKKLKVYLNDKPLAILLLEDRRSKQFFKFDPIGNGKRADPEILKLQPGWTLKFEILEVYKGSKYDDVAITEIFFDGLDVH